MALKLAEGSFCSDAKSFRPRRQFIVRFEYEYEGFGLFIDQFVMHAQLLNSKIGAVPPGDPEDVLPGESDRNRELFPSPMRRFSLAK